jgi:alpha-tubulin suppressor-like RCC1 family protein
MMSLYLNFAASNVIGLDAPPLTLSAGDDHTCVLTSSGGVKCWGLDLNFELGDGQQINSPAPVDVLGLTSGATRVATRRDHTCAITSTGGVKCWGSNIFGQLGNGNQTYSAVPVDVMGLAGPAIEIATTGESSCAILSGGGIQCWGTGAPAMIPGAFSGIVGGNGHYCAFRAGGDLVCWGYNSNGQLGDGTTTDSLNTPVKTCLQSN